MYKLITRGGYPFDEVTSALIKTLRRGHEQEALFWGLELLESFPGALWKRLAIFAAEDVGLTDPNAIVVVNALWACYERIRKVQQKGQSVEEDLGILGVLYLVRAPKSREADSAKNYMQDRRAAGYKAEVPPFALNSHTARGRELGKATDDWWIDEPGTHGRYELYAMAKKAAAKLKKVIARLKRLSRS